MILPTWDSLTVTWDSLTATWSMAATGTGGLTHIRVILLDAAGSPRVRVHVRARVNPPAGSLIEGPEVVAPAERYTDAFGLVEFTLIPVAAYDLPGATYDVTWDGVTRTITVPDFGPNELEDVTV